MKFWNWLSGLLGNSPKVVILIFVFLAILIGFAVRCHAQTQVHLAGGVSFGKLHGGPVLGLDLVQPLADGLAWDVGTTLYGRSNEIANNFDWHARVEFSRGSFGAAIGPSYVQNIDATTGSHLNFSLMLFFRPGRLGAQVIHTSNAGTTSGNAGHNAALADVRLR